MPFTVSRSSTSNKHPNSSLELSKYAELLVKGNPKLVEPLYATHFLWSTEEWNALLTARSQALNQTTVAQYLSFSRQKIHSIEKDDDSFPSKCKQLYHAFRLALEAFNIVQNLPVRDRTWNELYILI